MHNAVKLVNFYYIWSLHQEKKAMLRGIYIDCSGAKENFLGVGY